jgi:hypothetical protein
MTRALTFGVAARFPGRTLEDAMSHASLVQRSTFALLTLATVLVVAAPAAQADRGGRRYKYSGPERVIVRDRSYRPVYRNHSSGVAPALLGFVGGLIVGSTIQHHETVVRHDTYIHHDCPPPHVVYTPRNDYYDPYCHETFSSLDEYYDHTCRYDHPRVAQIIDVRSGEIVGECSWQQGGWQDDPYFRDDARGDDDGRDD